jgi:hypothetical protein
MLANLTKGNPGVLVKGNKLSNEVGSNSGQERGVGARVKRVLMLCRYSADMFWLTIESCIQISSGTVTRWRTYIPQALQLWWYAAICHCLLSLYLCLSNDIGLVNGSLHNLLLFWIEVLCEVFVEGGLFLL